MLQTGFPFQNHSINLASILSGGLSIDDSGLRSLSGPSSRVLLNEVMFTIAELLGGPVLLPIVRR